MKNIYADKKIILLHFKIGERDGVSLEIEKRAKILASLGAEVFYVAGSDGLHHENAYLVEGLNAETSYNQFLREHAFRQRYFEESALAAIYSQIELKVYQQLQQAFLAIQPDLLFVHNVFSHGCNLPATTALVKVLDKYEIPTIAIHHDFWYEREQLQHPQYSFIQEIVDVLPPKRSYIVKQQVINSIASEEMLRRRGIQSDVIGDYFDFHQPIPERDEYNQDLRKTFGIREQDILILHGTRITPHKVIENALLFASELEHTLRIQAPVRFGSRVFEKDSRVVVLFSNFVEPEAVDYFQALKQYQQQLGVQAVWASERFLPERRQDNIGGKVYSFWDSYVVADLVTYTSIQEGFGNQLLETVYFKKVPVLLEYPVFEKDLKAEGYRYISLGPSSELISQHGFRLVAPSFLQQAVMQTITTLQDVSAVTSVVENNFQIAKEWHDVAVLEREFEEFGRWIFSE